ARIVSGGGCFFPLSPLGRGEKNSRIRARTRRRRRCEKVLPPISPGVQSVRLRSQRVPGTAPPRRPAHPLQADTPRARTRAALTAGDYGARARWFGSSNGHDQAVPRRAGRRAAAARLHALRGARRRVPTETLRLGPRVGDGPDL